VNLLINGLHSASASVSAGGTLNVQLTLQVTAGEQVTGLDYYFQELSAAGFFIVSRDITGSAFSDAYFSNAQVAHSTDAQPPAGADNALNPRNDYDPGAVTNPVGTVAGSGLIGNFVIGVGAGVAPGVYTISTTSNPNTGWVGPGPNFPDHAFSNQASIQVSVPEPATWSLPGLGAIGAICLHYLRSRNKGRLG
jgi:hypothetical protein